jgi:hypothetical protein
VLPLRLLLLLLLLLMQALDKAFDMQADVCKAMRNVDFDQQLLNKVRCFVSMQLCVHCSPGRLVGNPMLMV